jgi:glutamate formiminotransferase / formiminotetrahydrofolate cyclodeaminase
VQRLVECVPNISEGRDKQIIDAVVDAIKSVSGAEVLDVDPGFDTNRTVITFVGSPEIVEEAAFQCIKKSHELIDMCRHTGAHPRQGCTDVCPFIPISGVTMDDCVAMAKRLGQRVSSELGVPIYLYGYAASSKERKDLAFVRKGEYESLPEKLGTLKPDFGPSKYNDTIKRSGAVQISARDFLIAYNVNLNTRDKSLANEIALSIREAGRAKRDEKGEIVRDKDGKAVNIPGLLKEVKAIGWYIDQYGVAQISINLTNYKTTPVHKLFETCVQEAEKLGLRVTGSELVGLVPKDAIVEAGKYFIKKAKRSTGVPEKELIHVAVKSLGLEDISPFNIEEKVIEYKISRSGRLCGMKLEDFIDEVAKDSPAPGGGSVSALAGSLGAGLGAMVASLTVAKKGYESTLERLSSRGDALITSLEDLKRGIDLDTEAFNDVIAAMRMPKNTDDEKRSRDKALEEGYKKATLVPFNTAQTCVKVLEQLCEVAEIGNPNSASDVGVGALMAYAGFEGAVLNVKINLPSIKDDKFKNELNGKIDGMRSSAVKYRDKVLGSVNEKISK